jgi:hypothetical protein
LEGTPIRELDEFWAGVPASHGLVHTLSPHLSSPWSSSTPWLRHLTHLSLPRRNERALRWLGAAKAAPELQAPHLPVVLVDLIPEADHERRPAARRVGRTGALLPLRRVAAEA